MPRFHVRWVFALATVAFGVYVVFHAGADHAATATGLGLITAGVATVAP